MCVREITFFTLLPRDKACIHSVAFLCSLFYLCFFMCRCHSLLLYSGLRWGQQLLPMTSLFCIQTWKADTSPFYDSWTAWRPHLVALLKIQLASFQTIRICRPIRLPEVAVLRRDWLKMSKIPPYCGNAAFATVKAEFWEFGPSRCKNKKYLGHLIG